MPQAHLWDIPGIYQVYTRSRNTVVYYYYIPGIYLVYTSYITRYIPGKCHFWRIQMGFGGSRLLPCCQSLRVSGARPAGGGGLTESFRLGRPKPDSESGLGLCLAARGGFTESLASSAPAGPARLLAGGPEGEGAAALSAKTNSTMTGGQALAAGSST